MMKSADGVTLMELMIASTISVVVVLGLGQLDVTRLLMTQHVRDTGRMGSEAALAMAQLARDVEQADRVNLVSLNPADVQLRIPQAPVGGPPAPTYFDLPSSYRWVEYKLFGTEIRFYDRTETGNCEADRTFRDIGTFAVAYDDQAKAPPGNDEPFAPETTDNNLVSFHITTVATPAVDMIDYHDTVALRAGAYTNVNAGNGDSGIGLDWQGNAPRPGTC